MSNYFMWLVVGEKEVPDPRLRFYFYRQTSNSLNAEPNIYSCVYNSGPPDANSFPGHYREIDSDLPYCIASQYGYYGRDHMNGSDIPPDDFARTSYGVYPGGAALDKSYFRSLSNWPEDGLKGSGIAPIFNSSFTHFQLAEFALESKNIAIAREYLKTGIHQSFSKLDKYIALIDTSRRFQGALPSGGFTIGQLLFANFDDLKAEYIESVLTEFDKSSAVELQLDIVVKEHLISLWGNALDAYNLYRRTGLPLNIQPSISPAPGSFPRTLLYPSVHVNRNENVSQKTFSTPVFWDTNDGSIFNR